jgi:hypothetical protein
LCVCGFFSRCFFVCNMLIVININIEQIYYLFSYLSSGKNCGSAAGL